MAWSCVPREVWPVADSSEAGGGVRRGLRNVALGLLVVGATALIPWRREEDEGARALPVPQPDPNVETPEPESGPQPEPAPKPSPSLMTAGLPRWDGSTSTATEGPPAPIEALDSEEHIRRRRKNIHPDVTAVTVGLGEMLGVEALSEAAEVSDHESPEEVDEMTEPEAAVDPAPTEVRRRWLRRARKATEDDVTPLGTSEIDPTVAALFGLAGPAAEEAVAEQVATESTSAVEPASAAEIAQQPSPSEVPDAEAEPAPGSGPEDSEARFWLRRRRHPVVPLEESAEAPYAEEAAIESEVDPTLAALFGIAPTPVEVLP